MLNTRIDLPLQGDTTKEPLGLIPYADALSGFVKTCETPLTVGIQGDWGIGKTSLLNLVRHRLETPDTNRDRREYPTVYFNTWQYAQLDGEQHLTVALLGDLVRRIGALDQAPPSVQDQARGLLRKVGRMAASAGSQVIESQTGINVEKALGNDDDGLPEVLRSLQLVVEYKAEFERLVRDLLAGKEAGSRLVIMIDDLDRIRPARALDLLASVKNFLDVPGCVFLLAVDYEVIQRGVAETMGVAERKRHGKSYFDKIIQVPFNMPVASYEVGKYVMALLGWTWSAEKERYAKADGADGELWFKYQQTVAWDVARDLENLTTLTVGRNPRAIKRAANYFALLKRVFDANGGQDAAKARGGNWQDRTLRLLYGMACFQLAYPELFTLFVQEPTPTGLRRMEDIDYLGTLAQMRTIGERVADVDETMSQVAGFFDQVVSIVDEDGSGGHLGRGVRGGAGRAEVRPADQREDRGCRGRVRSDPRARAPLRRGVVGRGPVGARASRGRVRAVGLERRAPAPHPRGGRSVLQPDVGRGGSWARWRRRRRRRSSSTSKTPAGYSTGFPNGRGRSCQR